MPKLKFVSLYETDDTYTREARQFARRISNVMDPHIARMVRRGFSWRDIERVVNAEVGGLTFKYYLLKK